MKIQLKKHQRDHSLRLKAFLEEYSAAVDCSTTGAGKTFVALFLAHQFGLPLWIQAPKSVCGTWERLVETFGLPVERILTYSMMSSRGFIVNRPVFVVCDEFHLLKNDTQRNKSMIRFLSNLPKGSKTLFLSATPYDKENCEDNINRLFNAVSKKVHYKQASSEMNLKIRAKFEISNRFYPFDKDDVNLYQKGVEHLNTIGRIADSNPPPPPQVIAGLITKGTQKIHKSCRDTLLKVARQKLKEPNRKVVIIGKYHETLGFFERELKEFGTVRMDGKSVERNKLIDSFQRPDTTKRVFITSAQVGGVGVNLDDQDGRFPRTMLILPTYDGIDFVQCLGRIYRTHTKSKAEVIIIYPKDQSTPILRNIKSKLGTMSSLSRSIKKLKIKEIIEN